MATIFGVSSSVSANPNPSFVLAPPKLSASSSVSFLSSRGRTRGFPLISRTVLPHRRRTVRRINAKKQTFSSFDDLIAGSDKPVLVDFYATWCGPCQYMVSVLNEVGHAMKDTINVVKVDTEKYPSIANHYSIEALPTLIIFRDGKPSARFEGALPADQLMQWINNALDTVAV
ncbi:Thioredoxin Y [Nymphaea thermarum]|nr:Thioredoxin Y [Nymphaea thermarum]